MSEIFANPLHQQLFDRNGYVVARLFSEEDARAFDAEIQALAPDGGFASNSDSRNPYHASYFDENRDNRRRAYAFAQRAIAEPVAALVRGYRMVSGAYVIKRPGDGAVPLHRDWTLTGDAGDTILNCWCPLVDTDDVNGALRLIAGSHRVSPNIETAYVAPFFAGYALALREMAVPVPVKAGEALIFDAGVLHWSDTNRSDAARLAIVSIWIPEHSRAVFYALDRTSGGSSFELFDMEEGGLVDCTPAEHAALDFSRASLGFVPNRNRDISFEEFVRLLAQGAVIRPDTLPARPVRRGTLARLKELVFARH
jgi:ectoine hydroxylase-related dioxygenase (phytanoyl-CoA dioxygenase family)